MSKPKGSDDQDQQLIDDVISLALDVIELSNQIKDISQNPDILYLALKQEAAGLMIQKQITDYRPRLKTIKKMALKHGDIRRFKG
jgi:hypothetical protein